MGGGKQNVKMRSDREQMVKQWNRQDLYGLQGGTLERDALVSHLLMPTAQLP